MVIQPYSENKCFEEIVEWIADERTHAMWSANRFAYPLTQNSFEGELQKLSETTGDVPYVVWEEGKPAGFFVGMPQTDCLGVYLKFIVLNHKLRGLGIGTKMLQCIAAYFLEEKKLEKLELVVFASNPAAKRCYEKAGFVVAEELKETFSYKDEQWKRYRMVKRK